MSKEVYERFSAPSWKRVVGQFRKVLDDMEPERYGPFGSAITQAQQKTRDIENQLSRVMDVIELFMPFVWENRYVFITQNTRNLFHRMDFSDREALPFDTENFDWRHYWLDVHIPGLEKWVFPNLELDGPKRISIQRDYKDLVELFDARTREHSRHVAYRIIRRDDVADSYTYSDIRKAAKSAAELLQSIGITSGDRVLLISEGRPEWGMSYFSILIAGATAVPLDVDLSASELENIALKAEAKLAIASPKYLTKLRNFPVKLISFDELFKNAHTYEESEAKLKRKPEDTASIIFTSGTTGNPKGVVLSHQNFTALTARMGALFDLNRTDALLSVLPPHHTFEFSAGLLMPLAKGASVTYLEERTPELLGRAFDETPVTGMIGVPALIETLHRRIEQRLDHVIWPVRLLIQGLIKLNHLLRKRLNMNLGVWIFRPVHNAFGGRLRYLVSGAAPLKPSIFKDLHGFGFSVYEGYGLTEAAPVLTVGWPGYYTPPGSVGWPLPGVEVRISDADNLGVGEVIARGPTIMQGYFNAPDATQQTLIDGWLHTGDKGRIDEDGHLYIVGRVKDVIIDSSGKNVYPDEIEELYSGHPLVQELSVVGLPSDSGTGEKVAAIAVPDYDAKEATTQNLSREEVREQVRTHFKEVSSKLPFVRRIKVLHLWDRPLPKTSTRKVKRSLVQKELLRIEQTLSTSRQHIQQSETEQNTSTNTVESLIRATISAITRKNLNEVTLHSRLVDDLGFDSLMQLELYTTLEAANPNMQVSAEELVNATTVSEVIRLLEQSPSPKGAAAPVEDIGSSVSEDAPLHLPWPITTIGRSLLGRAYQSAYNNLLNIEVEGRGNIPANRNFIVASNHASHLDMGLVKHALGEFGKDMRTLAARDYFFGDPIRRAYFENFTNLLPMDRHGSLKKSLRLATASIRRGEILLLFPEGTRSRNGQMASFKPAIGYLCLHDQVDILPMWLEGTYEAMPKGTILPKSKNLKVRIGEPIRFDVMSETTKDMSRSKAYRYVTHQLEQSVRQLGHLPPLESTEYEEDTDSTEVKVSQS